MLAVLKEDTRRATRWVIEKYDGADQRLLHHISGTVASAVAHQLDIMYNVFD